MVNIHWLDALVLFGTLAAIVIYGTWKTRKSKNIESYLLGDQKSKWFAIGLSVMATQASAITFLSTPGKAFEDGMGFVQFYLSMPIALVIICIFFIPIYYKLKVFTAYQYLESRFDLKTRLLTAFLFLVQRGLAAGITIYAPAIILSVILGWSLNFTILFVGILVIIYTVSGGSKAVTLTHKWQMMLIMAGMFIAFFILIDQFPDYLSFGEAISVADRMGKLDILNFDFDLKERYTVWSALFGALFLFLSYFGTDQSQVQRYLGGKSIRESQIGLLFNAIFKIPMQFFILLVGIMVFIFYQFEKPPLYFNQSLYEKVQKTNKADSLKSLENEFTTTFNSKKNAVKTLVNDLKSGNENEINLSQDLVLNLDQTQNQIRKEAQRIISRAKIDEKSRKDSDYVFIGFVMKYLPHGIIGLLLAVIFSAAMSSTSGEINALASTTSIDFYKRLSKKKRTDKQEVLMSKMLTVFWGILAICFALVASLYENLIEFVNILGSIFYGTILGVFIVAFFIKFIKSNAVFWAAIISEIIVIILYLCGWDEFYLWLNLVGCVLVVGFALIYSFLEKSFQPS